MKKIEVVRQRDIKDCGVCCLLSVIRYYGGNIVFDKLKGDLYQTEKGITVYHIEKTARKYGFDSCSKRIDIKHINNVKLPCIVHIKYENGLTHFMVLYKVEKNKVVLMDPSKGKEVLSINEFCGIFTGVLIEIFPKGNIIKFEKNMKFKDLLLSAYKTNKKLFYKVLLCNFSFAFLSLIFSLFFKTIYESLVNNYDFTILKVEVYIFLVVLIMKYIFSYYKNSYQLIFEKNVDVDVHEDFFNHLFNLPLKVINNYSIGDIITRVQDLDLLKKSSTELFANIISELIVMTFSLILLLINNTNVVYILFIFVIMFIVFVFLVKDFYFRTIDESILMQVEYNSTVVDTLSMIDSIKNLGIEKKILQRIESKKSNSIIKNIELEKILNLIALFEDMILDIGIFVINIILIKQVIENNCKIMDLILINAILNYLSNSLKNLANMLLNINYLQAKINRICDFMSLEKEKINAKVLNVGNIVFKNVYYSYDDYRNVLSDISFEVKSKEKVFIKGKSGSGKSTICQLLLKNIIPSKGSITIGDNNLNDFCSKEIKKKIIYVGQKENIFSSTLEDNLCIVSKNHNYDQVCSICKINEIANTKPFRYETFIDSDCSNVSGGEKQRIILARSLMKNAEIYIFDEALSEVDINMEREIINSLLVFLKDKTVIYISHKDLSSSFDRTIEVYKNDL